MTRKKTNGPIYLTPEESRARDLLASEQLKKEEEAKEEAADERARRQMFNFLKKHMPTHLPPGTENLDYRKLRELPAFDDVFGDEMLAVNAMLNKTRVKTGRPPLIMHRVDRAITEITQQYWPEILDSMHGGCLTVEPEDGVKLEKLCEMFGVPLKLKLCSVAVIGHAYDIFCLGMASCVRKALEYKDDVDEVLYYLPHEWRAYIVAVAQQRQADAQRMARELRVLRYDADYPPRFWASDKVPPEEMDAALDALWAIEDAKAK